MFHDKAVLVAAQQHARREFPKESVGQVVGGVYEPLVNRHETPTISFLADMSDAAEGLIHSHTDGSFSPSILDMQQQQAMDIPWGIVKCTEKECSHIEWFGDGTPVAPYLGRTFLDGVRDCWCLVRDWYFLEKGVRLDNLPRQEYWYLPPPHGAGLDLLNQLTIRNCGFYEITQQELQPGDVILGKVASPVVNHAGLYLGNGLVMHHMGSRLSCKEPLGRWLRYCKYFVRHETCRR